MKDRELSDEENDRLRAYLRDLLPIFKSQAALGAALKIDQSTLSGFLKGRSGTSLEVLASAAQIGEAMRELQFDAGPVFPSDIDLQQVLSDSQKRSIQRFVETVVDSERARGRFKPTKLGLSERAARNANSHRSDLDDLPTGGAPGVDEDLAPPSFAYRSLRSRLMGAQNSSAALQVLREPSFDTLTEAEQRAFVNCMVEAIVALASLRPHPSLSAFNALAKAEGADEADLFALSALGVPAASADLGLRFWQEQYVLIRRARLELREQMARLRNEENRLKRAQEEETMAASEGAQSEKKNAKTDM